MMLQRKEPFPCSRRSAQCTDRISFMYSTDSRTNVNLTFLFTHSWPRTRLPTTTYRSLIFKNASLGKALQYRACQFAPSGFFPNGSLIHDTFLRQRCESQMFLVLTNLEAHLF